eukprot:COSAG02_NODE_287_length_25647_cov_245.259316_3_plen_76_part_00
MRMKAHQVVSLFKLASQALRAALRRYPHVVVYDLTALPRSHVSCARFPATNPGTLHVLQWTAARLIQSSLHAWNI